MYKSEPDHHTCINDIIHVHVHVHEHVVYWVNNTKCKLEPDHLIIHVVLGYLIHVHVHVQVHVYCICTHLHVHIQCMFSL